MDSNQPPSTGRKFRFTPKVPPRTRSQIKAAAQLKADEADEAAKAQQLRSHFHELDSIRRQQSKPESKSSVQLQPTFINGPKQSSASKASNVPHDQSHDGDSSSLELNDNDNENFSIHSSFTDDLRERKMTCAFDSPPKPKDYREPWDYAHTYYPTTVPWRRPYSGDPDILNEAEFGKVSRTSEYDENAINPASELGFLDLDEVNENTRLIFFQLPPSLPFMKRSASAKGKEKESTSVAQDQRIPVTSAVEGKGSSVRVATSQRLRSLEELPAGNLGKLVVYKSGALKLKLGDVLCDVSPGSDCSAAQEVMAVNTKDKECCAVGELHNRALVTPAIDHLLDSVIDLC